MVGPAQRPSLPLLGILSGESEMVASNLSPLDIVFIPDPEAPKCRPVIRVSWWTERRPPRIFNVGKASQKRGKDIRRGLEEN